MRIYHGFLCIKRRNRRGTQERYLLTEGIWTEHITSLFLFHLLLWMYQDYGGAQTVVHTDTAFRVTCTFLCYPNVISQPSLCKLKEKNYHFIASLTQTPPTWGTELPLAAFLDVGGTGVFGGQCQSELSEGDVCICLNYRELRDMQVPDVGMANRAPRFLAFVTVQRARNRKGNWEIRK